MFEVPDDARGLIDPVPLKAMGRFEHETAPVDPKTGIVYMTEDNGDPGDGFYRRPGQLAAGGQLQMLAVTGDPEYDTATGQRVGEVLDVHWGNIDEPDPSDGEDNPGSVFSQGRAKGGARFLGLEGSTWAHSGVTFVASEDGDGEDVECGDNWLRTLTPAGGIANLAQVIELLDLHYWDAEDFPEPGPTGASELAGPVFTGDGRFLFVNVRYPGVTCVITGPWGHGPA